MYSNVMVLRTSGRVFVTAFTEKGMQPLFLSELRANPSGNNSLHKSVAHI